MALAAIGGMPASRRHSPLRTLVSARGAVGVWPMADGSGLNAFNLIGQNRTNDNLFVGPERVFSGQWNENPWSRGALTVTDDYAANQNGVANAASRAVASASAGAYLFQTAKNLPAGTYTVSLYVASNTGAQQACRMGYDGPTWGSDITIPATGWTRISLTYTKAATGDSTPFPLAQASTGAAIDLLIYGAKLNSGSSATPYLPPQWDFQFDQSYNQPWAYPTWDANGISLAGQSGLMAENDIDCVLPQVSVYVAAKWANPASAPDTPLFSEHYGAPFGNNYLTLNAGNDSNTGYARFCWGNNNATNKADAYALKAYDGQWHIIAGVYDGSTLTYYIDDCPVKQNTSAGLTPLTLRQLLLGTFQFTAGWNGEIGYAALYAAGHTTAEAKQVGTAIRALLTARGITITPLQKLVAIEGDSISDVSAGTGTYPNLMMKASTKLAQGSLQAVAGSGMTNVQSRKAAVKALYDATRASNVLFLLIGRNDFAASSTTTTDAQNYWTNTVKPYVTEMRQQGWKVVMATLLPSTVYPNYDTVRDAFNATMKADSTSYDGLADFAANATMGPDGAAANTTYYSDGTHPTLAGHQILAPIAQAAVESFL